MSRYGLPARWGKSREAGNLSGFGQVEPTRVIGVIRTPRRARDAEVRKQVRTAKIRKSMKLATEPAGCSNKVCCAVVAVGEPGTWVS